MIKRILYCFVCVTITLNTTLYAGGGFGGGTATNVSRWQTSSNADDLSSLQSYGTVTFFKDYALNTSSLNADYSVGTGTATMTVTRVASNPATYNVGSGVVTTTTTSNTGRFTSGYYDATGFHSRPGLLFEGASTNELTYSGDISNAAWVKTGTGGPVKNNYEVSMGTLLEGFEASSDWTAAGGAAAVADDSTNVRSGSESVELTTDTGTLATMDKTISLSLSDKDNFIFWVYCPDVTKISAFRVRFSSVASDAFTTSATMTFDSDDFKNNGWSSFMFTKSDMTLAGGESLSNTMLRMRMEVTPVASQVAVTSFDDFRYGYNAGGKAVVMWVFDDNYISHYNDVRPIFEANGQKINLAIVGNLIDGSGRMTTAQMLEMYNNGHDIMNHSETHADMTTRTAPQLETEINTSKSNLDSDGFTRSSKFFVYPSSSSNDTVIAKVKENHVLARTGYASGATKNGIPHVTLGDNDREFKIESYSMGSSGSATVQGWIDNAIDNKSMMIIYQHDATTGNGVLARLTTLSAYCKTKQDAGLLDVLSFSDYYAEFDSTTTAPDGTTVDIISAADNNATVLQTLTYASSVSTFSVFLKAGRVTGNIELTLDNGSTWTPVTLPSSGWGRFQITQTLANPVVGIRIANQGDSVYMWGGQVEKLAFATSYIPTTSAALTRNAEKLQYANTGNRTAATETAFVKFTPLWNGADAVSYRLISNDTKERLIFLNSGTDKIAFRPNSNDSGTASVDTTTTPVRFTSYVVAGVAHGATTDPNETIYLDGTSEASSNTDYTSPAWGTNFYVGTRSTTGLEAFAIIESVTFYSNVLSAPSIASVTTILET